MAHVSTFEILLKPQLPKSITEARPELAPLARTILQGYFLTISNLSNKLVFLSLVVTTRSPGLETEVDGFYWTDSAPDIVNPEREEQGLVSV
ncbi:hypothetical protein [Vulcanococcus limneticus]|uniref:hypothetical protein n=1 Tax=Vulcanococcus limneticus TaxID=2170428 RepID=UPI000B999A91|nr:hypothetical protein [Vulcanococcus limneticus]